MAHTDSLDTTDNKAQLPPYLPASTFLSTIEGWRTVRPSRVDRGVLNKVAGSMQTWLIAALRYFALIDDAGVPTPKLDQLATAKEEDKPKLIAELLRTGYPFLFTKGVDLSNITHSDLKEKFEATGAKGETAVKAMSFFTAMAKAANIQLSPFVATRQRRQNGPKVKPLPPMPRNWQAKQRQQQQRQQQAAPATTTKTPTEMLIDILDVEGMDDDEQQAVWTLVRYLKKRGS